MDERIECKIESTTCRVSGDTLRYVPWQRRHTTFPMKYMTCCWHPHHGSSVDTHTTFPMKQLTVSPHRVSSETIGCDDDTHTVFPVKCRCLSNSEDVRWLWRSTDDATTPTSNRIPRSNRIRWLSTSKIGRQLPAIANRSSSIGRQLPVVDCRALTDSYWWQMVI